MRRVVGKPLICSASIAIAFHATSLSKRVGRARSAVSGGRCNAVLAGATDTPDFEACLRPEDVAAAMLSLATAEADFVTGAELPVDAGLLV